MESKQEGTGNAIIVGADVLIHDPMSVKHLREGGNTLVIPWSVLNDLHSLEGKPDIGIDANQAAQMIEDLQEKNDPTLIIASTPSRKYFKYGLSNKNNKHHLLATTLQLQDKDARKYKKFKLVSRTKIVRIQARQLGVDTENYLRDRIEVPLNSSLKEINVEASEIDKEKLTFPFDKKSHDDIGLNEGVLCHSDFRVNGTIGTSDWGEAFTAIRKNGFFKIIPTNITASKISPFTLNGDGPNWHQMIALSQLLDQNINLCFLGGGAGTGKTLLALAAAIEMRSQYQQIVIARPMVSLEDEDKMGFLPGEIDNKIAPWFVPIIDNLNYIKKNDDGSYRKLVENMQEQGKINFAPLDYIRGTTFHHKCIIIDEGQNLTPHQIKTIITRVGIGTKLIFTGDLGQIDRKKKLDSRSSGLAYAMSRMKGKNLVSTVVFKNVVRSELACLAEELL